VQTLLAILLWLTLLYISTLAAVMILSMWILRQKLRKYQENGRFGY
jgi:hypothetical protein